MAGDQQPGLGKGSIKAPPPESGLHRGPLAPSRMASSHLILLCLAALAFMSEAGPAVSDPMDAFADMAGAP